MSLCPLWTRNECVRGQHWHSTYATQSTKYIFACNSKVHFRRYAWYGYRYIYFQNRTFFGTFFFSQKFYNYRVLSIIGKFSIKIYCQVPPYPTLYGTGRELNIFLVQYSYLHYTYINNIGRYTLFCSVPVSSVFPNC